MTPNENKISYRRSLLAASHGWPFVVGHQNFHFGFFSGVVLGSGGGEAEALGMGGGGSGSSSLPLSQKLPKTMPPITGSLVTKVGSTAMSIAPPSVLMLNA